MARGRWGAPAARRSSATTRTVPYWRGTVRASNFASPPLSCSSSRPGRCSRGLCCELVKEGAKGKTIAHVHGISEAEVSHLSADLADVMEAQHGMDKLLGVPQPDTAVAIDETFLKIEGKTIYAIIATGYTTHKTLGVRVSATRREADLEAVFREAESNIAAGTLPTASADEWVPTPGDGCKPRAPRHPRHPQAQPPL